MAVKAYAHAYQHQAKDKLENFHGNQLVYVNWDKHLLFAAPFTLMVPQDMTFGALLTDVLPNAFGQHPEWCAIKWQNVHWLLDNEPFTPDFSQVLADQGVKHKSFLRFQTPDLKGIDGAGI